MKTGGTTKVSLLTILVMSMLLGSCSTDFHKGLYTEHTSSLAPLILRIRVDHPEQACMTGGDSLDIRFTVSNVGQQLIALESKDTPVLDVVIREWPSMEIVSSWAEQNPDQVQHRVEWQAGESKTLNLKGRVPLKIYFGQRLDISGLVSLDNPSNGQHYERFALISLCLATG